MQVTEHLSIDGEAFFGEVKKSILADIEEVRGKKAKASNVHAGYSYKRYLRGKRDEDHACQVRIVVWDPPREYRSTVTAQGGVTTISYVAEPTEDGGIDVTYTEEYEGGSAAQNIIQKGIGAVKQFPAKSGIKKQLRSIEARVVAENYSV